MVRAALNAILEDTQAAVATIAVELWGDDAQLRAATIAGSTHGALIAMERLLVHLYKVSTIRTEMAAVRDEIMVMLNALYSRP